MSIANKFNIPPALLETIKRMNAEGTEYQEKVKALMKKRGFTSIGQMSPEEKKDFFNTLDAMHKAKHEEVKSDVAKSFPASGVKKHTAPKGVSTMPKDKEKAKGQPAGSLKKEEVELDEAFPKSTQYALVHSSSKKIVAKGNKKEMTKKVKELNAKEKGSHYVGISYGSKVGDTFGFGPSPADKLSIRKEEVKLDESSKLTLDNILSKGEQINDRIKKHIDAADSHMAQARKIDKKDSNDTEGYNKHASLSDLHMKASWSLRNQKKSPNGNHLKDYTATHKKIQSRYKKEPQLTREEVELDEAIPKSTGHALVHSSSGKIVAKGNKEEMMKKMKELNAKEKGSHHLGRTSSGKVGDTFGLGPNPADKLSIRKEEVKLDEGKSGTGYELYHKDFSSAMAHAYDFAKKKYGIEIDPTEIDRNVAMGPRKPSSGKANAYRLLDKTGKKAIQVQVANLDNKRYELNMYKEDLDQIDESMSAAQIKKLRDAYASIDNVDVSGQPYKQLVAFLDKQDVKTLKMLAGAKIKFISGMAQNRVVRKMNESIGSTIGRALGQYAGAKMGLEGPGGAHGEILGRQLEMFARAMLKKLTKEEIELDEEETKEFMVKFEKQGKVSVKNYTGKSDLDVRSKAKVDAQRMGMTVASIRLKEEVEEAVNPQKSMKRASLSVERAKEVMRHQKEIGTIRKKRESLRNSFDPTATVLEAYKKSKMKKEATAKDKNKSVQSGDKLSGKTEPIEIDPELKEQKT